jgi:hypothetical protein
MVQRDFVWAFVVRRPHARRRGFIPLVYNHGLSLVLQSAIAKLDKYHLLILDDLRNRKVARICGE